MVYAVCSLTYAAFRKALGRDLTWGFERPPDADGRVRLQLRPHVEGVENAFYDRQAGTLSFGCFRASDDARGRNLPGGYTFTCLSHDVVTHETTHALLDGLRSHFAEPTNPDVLAFHEGFADLVAVFQRFSYPEVVREALRRARGEPGRSAVLTGLAAQMAQATGRDGDSIRPALDAAPTDAYARAGPEPHGRGGLLFGAVFEAFLTVFERKAAPVLRLATGGSGVLPEGDLAPDLLDALVKEATTLAGQFLTVCIRAVDYCPPVDLEFGEYLRALLTADRDLVPDDPWDYREALIDAFWRRGIFPSDVADLSEDALLWHRPTPGTPPVPGLRFGRVAFEAGGAGGRRDAVADQGRALADYLSDPDRLRRLGLQRPRDTPGDRIEPPCVQSARPSHRVGPDGQVVFDLVVEVTQRRVVDGLAVWGGATVILGPAGAVRYAVVKNPDSVRRLERQRAFLTTDVGRRFWAASQGGAGDLFGLLHRPAPPA